MASVSLVLGGADCLWDDLEELGRIGPVQVVAVNNAGIVYPGRLDHWATLHPEELAWREAKRAAKGYPAGYLRWTWAGPSGMEGRARKADRTLSGWEGGSSGLFGVGVGLAVSDTVICCGIPMDDTPHFDRVAGWDTADAYWPEWVRRADDMKGRVYSMSGRTRELLGPPDASRRV